MTGTSSIVIIREKLPLRARGVSRGEEESVDARETTDMRTDMEQERGGSGMAPERPVCLERVRKEGRENGRVGAFSPALI